MRRRSDDSVRLAVWTLSPASLAAQAALQQGAPERAAGMLDQAVAAAEGV